MVTKGERVAGGMGRGQNTPDKHIGGSTKIKHKSGGTYSPMCKPDVTKSIGERHAITVIFT